MTTYLITAYILVWPILASGIMALLCVHLVRDYRRAKQENTDMV